MDEPASPVPIEDSERKSDRPDLSRPSSGYIPDDFYDYDEYYIVINEHDHEEYDPYNGNNICGCTG